MNVKMMSLVVVSFFSIVASVVSAAEGKIIAVYGDSMKQKEPVPGWSYLWNAKGEIGKAANYVPFTKDGGYYAVWDESGKKMVSGTPHGWKTCYGKDGTPLFSISAYTMQNDSDGDVWLNNGNMQCRFGYDSGMVLNIYLNDECKSETPVRKQRDPLLFQYNFGKLKKGDSIYVAVGPGKNKPSEGHYGLQFTIEELPTGQKPAAPINIISPAITVSEPVRGPDGKFDKGYVNTHETHCKRAIANKPELILIGDSITAGWDGKVLSEKLGKFKPANMGISGDWIQKLHWRIDNSVFDQINPKVIVLLIGTNNLSNGYSPEEVVEGTGILVKALREKSPKSKILLMGIFQRGQPKEPIREMIRQVNEKTALLADNKTVFFMDINDNLVEADGSIRKEVMPDGLHPAAPGYVIWADAILPTLEKLFDIE